MATRGKKAPSNDPSYKSLKADYYPVQRTINLGSNPAGTTTNQVLDVAQCLSVVNHRLYRQGKTYQVKIDIDNRPNTSQPGMASVDVFALVDTWYIQKAWQLARQTYMKSMSDERAQIGAENQARWEDFRVASGVAAPSTTIYPYRYTGGASLGATDTDGEFLQSRITLSDGTTQRLFTWGSTGGSNLGMLEEYDKVANTNINAKTNDLAYAGVDDETNEASADDLKDRGDRPPYNPTNFNSSVWVKVATLDNSGSTSPSTPAGSSRMTTGYFNAPCGLIIVRPSVPDTQITGDLTLTVKAGKYKGVAAMNMGV